MPEQETLDVVIVGGGPAGWSAALLLGRARRHVLLIDAGRPRNLASRGVHAFVTREGTPPLELLDQARREALRYPDVKFRPGTVTAVAREDQGFLVQVDSETTFYRCRKLLLATGIVDELPSVAGLAAGYGRSVHHCPYCDGWEHRDQPIAVYGRGVKGVGFAIMLTLWSRDIVLCTDGEDQEARQAAAQLAAWGIVLREQRILRAEIDGTGALHELVFADGSRLARQALFFNTACRPGATLPAQLGCETGDRGGVGADPLSEQTSVPGVYVAGDASRDVLLVIVAAAEGAKAAVAINRELLKEEGRL